MNQQIHPTLSNSQPIAASSACFHWHTRAPEHIDGTLTPTELKEADQHIQECSQCLRHFEHFQSLTQAIAKSRKKQLPQGFLKTDPSKPQRRPTPPSLTAKWGKTPWFIRTGTEGLGIGLMVLLVVFSIPRIRNAYEKSMERRLGETLFVDEENHLGRDQIQKGKDTQDSNSGTLTHEPNSPSTDPDHFIYESEEGDDTSPSDDDTQKGTLTSRAEIWRFNLRTHSPQELRQKVIGLLPKLGLSQKTKGSMGILAPGGIQFDIQLDGKSIPQLRTDLEALVQSAATKTPDSEADPNSQPFTWYKNRSKKPLTLAPGHVRVVIWITQI